MDANFWINLAIYIIGGIGGTAAIYGIFCDLVDKKYHTGKHAELDGNKA